MLTLIFLSLLPFTDDSPFLTAEKEWRSQREASMKAETSWLNVAGLHWLKEGENSFGTHPDCDLVLPMHSTVENAGSFFLEEGKLRYKMGRGQHATIKDVATREGTLEGDQTLAHNHLRMFLIERDGKKALRVRDLRAKAFREFKELHFYKPREEYVVEATFVPYETPETIMIATVINSEVEMLVPGELKFTIDGKDMTLLPTVGSMEDEEYFIIFKDKTSGNKTYASGRFLYSPRAVDGKVTLNFNRAINPPCCYTDHATCPLPPEQNTLPISIEAGERTYKRDH